METGPGSNGISGTLVALFSTRWDAGATRQDLGAGTEKALVTPDSLGLQAAHGSIATIDGVTYYGSQEGWSLTAPAVEQSAGSTGSGEELLGFQPQWFPQVNSVIVDEEARPIGTVELNPRLYATKETAEKLAAKLGATAVAEAISGIDAGSMVPQWELDFGNGVKLNAGLVADMFVRDAARAFDRLRAEIEA
jgi:hypothetical protein